MQSLFWMGRHGETFLNESGLYRGWSNGPDARLNEAGRKSAHDMAQFLVGAKQPFSHVISSPLDRAAVTAATIALALGLTDIIIDDRLKPLNVGQFAGTKKSDNRIEPFLKNPSLRFPGGENILEFEARQADFQKELMSFIEKNSRGKQVLVLAHVSNIMYQWNEKTRARSEEYLGESTDIVLPGGLAIVNTNTVIPVFHANLQSLGITDEQEINEVAIQGEPGTGYESGAKGPFRCDNCHYFRPGENSCGQDDMKEKSKRDRTPEGRVLVQIDGCCEFVDRLGK